MLVKYVIERYCPVVCHCPFFRPMHQCAHFLACLLMTPVPDTYSLYLYCYPSLKQPEVEKKLSSYVIPYKGEGKSKKPTCFGDKIEVSLSAFHFVQGSQRNERIALKFTQNDISDNSHMALIVRLSSKSVPIVKFFKDKGLQKLLCEVPILKTQQASEVPGVVHASVKQEKESDSAAKKPKLGPIGKPGSSGVSSTSKTRKVKGDDTEIDQEPSTSGCGSPQLKFKDYPPTDHELFEISRFIADKWKQVGFALYLTSHQINEINNSGNDKAHVMLMEWRNSTDSSSPYEDLYNALCHLKVKRKKVAKDFCLMGIS